jgi:DNA (cytosine-5)-methyltransferase 1
LTVHDAIGDLPVVQNGEDRGIVDYRSDPRCEFQSYIREGSNAVTCHGASRLSQINVDRMKHIPQGGSWRDIPYDLLPQGMRKAKRSDHTKRYGRLKWDGLASTILTKCDPHWGAYFHPEQDRAITVREAARFQAFPDWFKFQGSKTEQYVQIGNAVPPLLGRRIAEGIRRSMESEQFMQAAE